MPPTGKDLAHETVQIRDLIPQLLAKSRDYSVDTAAAKTLSCLLADCKSLTPTERDTIRADRASLREQSEHHAEQLDALETKLTQALNRLIDMLSET